MARQKLARFEHNAAVHNVIEPGKEIFETVKQHWNEVFFKNNQPIVVELACGRGEYTTGLAKEYPDKNFIGIDIKGARIWKGSSVAIENNLQNVAFYRAPIDFIENYFAENELDEIWLTFPDPRPRDRDEKRRLCNVRYIEAYKKLLKPGGIFNFKTDNRALFDYGLDVVKSSSPQELIFTHDLYNSEYQQYHFGIETTYERIFKKLGNNINYLRCSFNK